MRCPTLNRLCSPPLGKIGWPWTKDSQQLQDRMDYGSHWPLVSIVTPSYNQGQFLEETIRSVLLQGYPALEYIIIDGGSTDGSVEIIRKYSPWLSYWVSEPDEGQAAAINKGFQLAKGEIIGWLNSDDLYLQGALANAVNTLEYFPDAGMVYGNSLVVDSHGNVIWEHKTSQLTLPELLTFKILSQPTVFFRRNALNASGLLNPSFHYLLDHELWIRIAKHYPIKYINSLLATSRRHPDAKNSSNASQFGKDAFRIVNLYSNDPDINFEINPYRQQMLAGAYAFDACYLIRSRQFRRGLMQYFKAVRLSRDVAGMRFREMIAALTIQLIDERMIAFLRFLGRRLRKDQIIR